MSYLNYFLLGCGIIFFVLVILLLLKNQINERYSVVWLAVATGILLISSYPVFIDKVAVWLGIDYPPALLFLFSTLVLLLGNLYQSIQISKLNQKIIDLTQFIALHQKERDHNQRQVVFSPEKEELKRYDSGS